MCYNLDDLMPLCEVLEIPIVVRFSIAGCRYFLDPKFWLLLNRWIIIMTGLMFVTRAYGTFIN